MDLNDLDLSHRRRKRRRSRRKRHCKHGKVKSGPRKGRCRTRRLHRRRR